MASFAEKPVLEFATPDEWEAWLVAHGPDDGVRLKLRKKLSGAPGLTYDLALDVALCHGWIDGQVARLDDDDVLQAFTPRRKNSPWSQRNVGHVARLIAEGRMREGGQTEIDRAKTDGRWDAAYRVKDAPVPDDLRAALDANPAAAASFEALSSQNRFAILFRIGNVKRADTRERNIARFVDQLARGETVYPQSPRP
ncbi:MAG: YdeI/OmpD-associated family protein [Salinibacterium sp.]|nr:YdeI/OmpD-associated family protein [Salinibacterium sp.]